MPPEKLPNKERSPYLPQLKSSLKNAQVLESSSANVKSASKASPVKKSSLKKTLNSLSSSAKNHELEKAVPQSDGDTMHHPKKNLFLANKKFKEKHVDHHISNMSNNTKLDSTEIQRRLNTAASENNLLKSQLKKYSEEIIKKNKEISHLTSQIKSLNLYKDKSISLEKQLKFKEASHKSEILCLRKELMSLNNQITHQRWSRCKENSMPNLQRSKSAIDKNSVNTAASRHRATSVINDKKEVKLTKSTGDLRSSRSKSTSRGRINDVSQSPSHRANCASQLQKSQEKRVPYIKPPLNKLQKNIQKDSDANKTVKNSEPKSLSKKTPKKKNVLAEKIKSMETNVSNACDKSDDTVLVQSAVRCHLKREGFQKKCNSGDSALKSLPAKNRDNFDESVRVVQSAVRAYLHNLSS